MQISTNKTKHMVINKQKQHVSIQPTLNNQTLEQVTNYKYLGAIIIEELNIQKNQLPHLPHQNTQIDGIQRRNTC